MPKEIMNEIVNKIGDFPITASEAKKIREDLIEERKVFDGNNDSFLNGFEFCLCEH